MSANMALALEDIGWGTADHWMRMQASYELAQARRDRGRCRTARERDARMIQRYVNAARRSSTMISCALEDDRTLNLRERTCRKTMRRRQETF